MRRDGRRTRVSWLEGAEGRLVVRVGEVQRRAGGLVVEVDAQVSVSRDCSNGLCVDLE